MKTSKEIISRIHFLAEYNTPEYKNKVNELKWVLGELMFLEEDYDREYKIKDVIDTRKAAEILCVLIFVSYIRSINKN